MTDKVALTITREDIGLLLVALYGAEQRALQAEETLAKHHPAIAQDAHRQAYRLAALQSMLKLALRTHSSPSRRPART